MSQPLFLCLFLIIFPVANCDVQCEGTNCRLRPVTLLPATTVTAPTPVTLLPASTPTSPHTANHTTVPPSNHTTIPVTHSTIPANHTTIPPANHTTIPPANHTTIPPANHTTIPPANHTTIPPANHTTIPPANHTTIPPANHTTHSVHTTPVHPTLPPVLQEGKYKVTDNKTVCAMASLKLQLRVQYKTEKKGKKGMWGVFMIQPLLTNSSGSCGTDTVNMTLTFPEGSLTFGFKVNSKQHSFYLREIQSELKYKFPGTSGPSRYTARNSSLQTLDTHLGHSFRCKNQSVKVTSSFWVDMVDEQIQAFNFSKNQEFGPGKNRHKIKGRTSHFSHTFHHLRTSQSALQTMKYFFFKCGHCCNVGNAAANLSTARSHKQQCDNDQIILF
ncbi:macrosialin-like isoform X2 [Heptranchias perlo]|uniref:macrosialin-like isoform X2 n=1 Tax=Heptranchias perlo TaxID=212740 RepID=UPI003559C267